MTSNPTLAISASGLVKSFGSTRAVDGLDLAVEAGTVYSIVGPNGAGKTTTIRMLATLLRPDAGSVTVLGHDTVREAAAVRERISLTGQASSVDEDLTGLQNLILAARLLGFPPAAATERAGVLIEAFGLKEIGNRLVKTYSTGERRRVDIAASLIVRPDLLFLDEPTTGLDPRSRSDVWAMIRALVVEGTTVLLTTQYMDEADRLSHRIGVIDHGRMIAEGTPAELKSRIGSGLLHVSVRVPAQRGAAGQLLAEVLGAPVTPDPDPTRISVPVADAGRAADALAALARSGIEVDDFGLGQPSLDEVYLKLTGHETPRPGVAQEEGVRA
jgi:ABC-2 type transport system ATP-binding protein